MIRQKEWIRMWNNIYEATAHICKMIDLFDYLWLNLLITMLFCHQLNSQCSFWIRTFTLVWALIWTQLTMKSLKLELKSENIFKHMKWSLALIKQALAKVRITMKKQIDKHWKKMIYKINDMMFLNSRNIMISRSLKKLNDKMLELFKILIKIEHAYQLKLSSTMKIHLKFALNLLQLNSKNFLKKQRNESSDFIVIEDEDEWKVKNILNFRHYERDKRLQYYINWKEYNVNLHWYNVNESEFKECLKIVNDFHEWYLNKSR